MKPLLKLKINFLSLFTCFAFNLNAQIQAESLEFDIVQAAITEAFNSTFKEAIVYLPEGTVDWGTNGIFINGLNKSLKLIGKGKEETIIRRTINTNTFLVDIRCNRNITTDTESEIKNYSVEIQDIGFIGNQDTDYKTDTCSSSELQRGVQLLNGCHNFKISNCTFANFGLLALGIDDNITSNPSQPTDYFSNGVIYNNRFENNFVEGCDSFGYGVSIGGNGKSGDPLILGTEDAIFIEDNYFIGNKHVVTSNDNSKYVFRYNEVYHSPITVDYSMTDAHGPGNSSPDKPSATGSRSFEIYNNNYYNNEEDTSLALTAIGIRGGDGVIFNNQVNDQFKHIVKLEIENEARLVCGDTAVLTTNSLHIWNNKIPDYTGTEDAIKNACSSLINPILNKPANYEPFTYPHTSRSNNLALGKPTISSTNNSTSALVVDNNSESFWTGINYHNQDWWQVDLNQEYNLSQIVLTNYYTTDRYYHYNIKGSAIEGDDAYWDSLPDLIIKNDNSIATKYGNFHDLTNIESDNIRFLRVYMTYNSANGAKHIVDFKAYGKLSQLNTNEKYLNLALDKITKSSTNNSTSMLAVDIYSESFWTGINYHKQDWWQVDLNGEYDINQIVLTNYYLTDRHYHYNIKGSTINGDNAYWDNLPDLVIKNDNSIATKYGNFHDLTNIESDNIRFLRVYMTHNSANGAKHIVDFKTYGKPSTIEISGKHLIIENDIFSDILVYPNPINTYQKTIILDLNAFEFDNIEVEIFNIIGQTTYTNTFKNTNKIISLDTQYFSKGLNFIKINSQKFSIIKKVFSSEKEHQ